MYRSWKQGMYCSKVYLHCVESTCTVVRNKFCTVVRGIYTLIERTGAIDRKKQGTKIFDRLYKQLVRAS